MENITEVCFLSNTKAGENQVEKSTWLLGIWPFGAGFAEWVLEVKSDSERGVTCPRPQSWWWSWDLDPDPSPPRIHSSLPTGQQRARRDRAEQWGVSNTRL